jgi:hypothetical protein
MRELLTYSGMENVFPSQDVFRYYATNKNDYAWYWLNPIGEKWQRGQKE